MTSTDVNDDVTQDTQRAHPQSPQPRHLTPSARRDLFGGRGEVKVWNLMSPRALDPFRAALWCELEPSGEVGRHVQQHYQEILICISGKGVVKIGQTAHEFTPGVCLTLSLGEILQITCGADTPLSYLIIKAEDS